MRRVIDDEHYLEVSEQIARAINNINPGSVSDYSYSSWRANGNKILNAIKNSVKDIKWGKYMNTTGIGNNASYEIIYLGNPKEEQICGIIHVTDDMYGSQICWVSDYDGKRSTKSRTIPGREPSTQPTLG